MAKSERNLTAIFQDTANAIRAKTGGTDEINPRDFADEIEAIPTGSSEIIPGPNDNVIIYDYDGTVLDAQQVAVGQEYTLPEGPTDHEDLVFDGWVATCAISNGKVTVPATGKVAIGALYTTNGNYIRIIVEVPANFKVVLHSLFQNVDWGDGTVTTNSNIHTYSEAGTYKIKANIGSGAYNISLIDNSGNYYANSIVKEINFPNIITGWNSAVNNYYLMEKISISKNIAVGNFTNNFLNTSYNLKAFICPKAYTGQSICSSSHANKFVLYPYGGTIIPNSGFNSCYSLKDFIIPEGTTTIEAGALQVCLSLKELRFPSTVTTIKSSSFNACFCTIYDFSHHASVPTLDNSNAFGSINDGAKIIVPDALYNDWIAASNWSTLASQIVKASEA